MLNKFLAKQNRENLEEHSQKLKDVLNQIVDIYGLNSEVVTSLTRLIYYHDIGKCTKSMQRRLQGEDCNYIRHEWIGASVKGLKIDEVLAILTHHKSLSKALELIDNQKYKDELIEIENKLKIKLNNISSLVKEVNKPRNKDIKNLDNILLKGYLNYCDHLGSAGNIKIDKGLNTLDKFKFEKYNSIQRQALEETEDVIIQAMTGLGKTATSLLWSNNVQNEENSKRIYYILPFTASINSLYKDFLNRDISTTMLHSKAEYFMDKIFKDFSKEEYKLMKYSTKQLNICTIFQLAKAIFSCKRYEMLLAQIKNSIIVVDEIHCFDIKTLSIILEILSFLKNKLNCRICIMSASIPSTLQKLIKSKLGISKVIYADKSDLIVRHKVERYDETVLDNINNIENDLKVGKQVIICVNNVNTSQELYKMFKDKYKCKLIHGRFNTRDREKAEQNLKENQLLIGTQAIEVSLDISYDVLYAEIAPLDALLQRFGRINRRGEKGICEVKIFNNYNKCIYDEDIIQNTDKVIKDIINHDKGVIFEEKVNDYLDKVYIEIDYGLYNKNAQAIQDIMSNLRVGNYNKNSTEDMISGDTISVVPEILLEEYLSLIHNKKYLEAQALKVNINQKRKYIDKDIFYKYGDIDVVKYKYNSKIGLEYIVDNIF